MRYSYQQINRQYSQSLSPEINNQLGAKIDSESIVQEYRALRAQQKQFLYSINLSNKLKYQIFETYNYSEKNTKNNTNKDDVPSIQNKKQRTSLEQNNIKIQVNRQPIENMRLEQQKKLTKQQKKLTGFLVRNTMYKEYQPSQKLVVVLDPFKGRLLMKQSAWLQIYNEQESNCAKIEQKMKREDEKKRQQQRQRILLQQQLRRQQEAQQHSERDPSKQQDKAFFQKIFGAFMNQNHKDEINQKKGKMKEQEQEKDRRRSREQRNKNNLKNSNEKYKSNLDVHQKQKQRDKERHKDKQIEKKIERVGNNSKAGNSSITQNGNKSARISHYNKDKSGKIEGFNPYASNDDSDNFRNSAQYSESIKNTKVKQKAKSRVQQRQKLKQKQKEFNQRKMNQMQKQRQRQQQEQQDMRYRRTSRHHKDDQHNIQVDKKFKSNQKPRQQSRSKSKPKQNKNTEAVNDKNKQQRQKKLKQQLESNISSIHNLNPKQNLSSSESAKYQGKLDAQSLQEILKPKPGKK